MEELVTLMIPALLAVVLVRAMLQPLGWVVKLGLHAACGFACLWLINLVAPFTGVYLPVNAVTVCISGLLGLPGIGIIALLEVV